MNLSELFILTILLKSTQVSSTKCSNPNVTCLELCCGMEQTYRIAYRYCEDLPEYAKRLWWGMIEDLVETYEVDLIEFGECSLSPQQSVIPKCYGPKYNDEEKDFELKEFTNVPCDRLKPYAEDRLRIGWQIVVIYSPILLPIMLLLTCIKKEKKNKLSYKLISWYLTMTIATLLLMQLDINLDDKLKSKVSQIISWQFLHNFFWISTYLWLCCIGYNVYQQFKKANVQNREGQDRMSFICFSIFVWGGTLTLCIADGMLKSWFEFFVALDVPMFLIACFNMLGFLILSLKICLIRCAVIGISTEKHIKCKLALIICRLCILMGIPRMLFAILVPVIGIGPYVITLHVEPYLVYGAFILEYENFSTLFRCKSGCSASQIEANDSATEDITMRNLNSV